MINYIVVHCAATKEGIYFDAQDIHRWHLYRGFDGIGYHYIVLLDGTVERGRPEYWKGAHVKNHNHNSIGVVYIGGLDKNKKPKDTRTDAQKTALRELLTELKAKYPSAKILGHRDFSKDLNKNGIIDPFERMKECPCFDAKIEYQDV